MEDKNFFDELKELYDVEDFTGHIGVLLSNVREDKGYEQDGAVEGALDFLQEIYDLATKHLQ